ncbi:MAG: hypothetical protein V1831_04390 [Candidatus Woesearchaeota archaeon]
MEPKKHGRNLVNLLSEYNGELVGVGGNPFPENKNGYGLQTLILTYQNERQQQIRVGVTLVKGELKRKKNNPTTYTNLSVVNLSRVKNREDYIYRLLRNNTVSGITNLFTHNYMTSDEDLAIGAYNQLNAVPPENTKELANMLGEYMVSSKYRIQSQPVFFPIEPQLRRNLGMIY